MTYSLRLAHLYPQRMSIYGDRGNIITLQRRAEWRGLELTVDHIEVGDRLDATTYNLFFFGGGQDVEQFTVAEDLKAKAERLRAAHQAGAAILAICGGYQLFGRSYAPNVSPEVDTTEQTEEVLQGVGIFPAVTVGGPERLIGNVVARASLEELNDQPVVGFENHSGLTKLDEGATPLATVQHGYGNNGQDGGEGCVIGSAIGTYLHGALLPKNPLLADWLLGRALQHAYAGVLLPPLPRPADVLETAANQTVAARFA